MLRSKSVLGKIKNKDGIFYLVLTDNTHVEIPSKYNEAIGKLPIVLEQKDSKEEKRGHKDKDLVRAFLSEQEDFLSFLDPRLSNLPGDYETEGMTPEELDFATRIKVILQAVNNCLLEKNKIKLSDTLSLNSFSVFSEVSPSEEIKVYIDQKLERIRYGLVDEDEDYIFDLIEYLVLLKVAKQLEE